MQKRYLTEIEQARLLKAAGRTTGALAKRDYHWMHVLMLTGMRIHEFSLLSRKMVQLAMATGWLVIPKELRKGKRTGNEHLITQALREHLEGLLEVHKAVALEREASDAAPLVWGRKGDESLSVRSYQDRLKIWLKAAELDMRVSPHWMRHTRAMNIVRRCRGDSKQKVVQQNLGHASIASSGVYIALSREEYEQSMQEADRATSGRMGKGAARALSARMNEQVAA